MLGASLSAGKKRLHRRLMPYTKPGALMCLQKALDLITLPGMAEARSGPIYSNIQLQGCS